MKYDVSLFGAVPLLVRRAPPTNYTGADRAIFLLFSFFPPRCPSRNERSGQKTASTTYKRGKKKREGRGTKARLEGEKNQRDIYNGGHDHELRENGKFKSADRRDEYGCRPAQEKHDRGETIFVMQMTRQSLSLLISRMCFRREALWGRGWGMAKGKNKRVRSFFSSSPSLSLSQFFSPSSPQS